MMISTEPQCSNISKAQQSHNSQQEYLDPLKQCTSDGIEQLQSSFESAGGDGDLLSMSEILELPENAVRQKLLSMGFIHYEGENIDDIIHDGWPILSQQQNQNQFY